MAPTPSSALSPAELSYLHTSLSSHPPIRPDSRSATSFRSLQAETGILPATNGSAHVSFSDGSECIVGVKLEVDRTTRPPTKQDGGDDKMDVDQQQPQSRGSSSWVSLTMTPLADMRDDDPSLVYLESMLLEPLTQTTLPEKLIINTGWHWHVYIDVLLISSRGLTSYSLPLLSMATHLALRDTRVPRLKSEGEEDPIADDDWMASVYLYDRSQSEDQQKPPITLLVVTINDNTFFDPSYEEIKIADSIIALSIGLVSTAETPAYEMLSMKTIETPARDTMTGVPKDGRPQDGGDVAGVWKPRVGGIKRHILKDVVKKVFNGGVAKDVMNGLEGFLKAEEQADRRAATR